MFGFRPGAQRAKQGVGAGSLVAYSFDHRSFPTTIGTKNIEQGLVSTPPSSLDNINKFFFIKNAF